MDLLTPDLPPAHLPSESTVYPNRLLLPCLQRWVHSSSASCAGGTTGLLLRAEYCCPVSHTDCVIEGQNRWVANGSRWTDSDDDCVTCTCHVSLVINGMCLC